MRVFAFDHRTQFEDMAAEANADPARIAKFKALCLEAAKQVAAGRPGYGILCDERLGRDTLYAAAGTGLWIGRPLEAPGSRPLALEIGPDLGSALAEWPVDHVAKVLCFMHPDDPMELREQQETTIFRLSDAVRGNGLEFLLEIISSKAGPVADDTTARVINRIYQIGVRPDWWKLEPMTTEAAWASTCAAIEQSDPWCRGVVVLGLDAPEAALAQSFAAAARHEMVKGFAVGRTIFGEVARAWFRGELDDVAAVATMAARFRRLCGLWDQERAGKGGAE